MFERYFGMKPAGVWLSEGGVSEDALALLDEVGFAWTASGEGVWRNSCIKWGCKEEDSKTKRPLFSPARIDGFNTRVFFRDDGLSDLIGFKYSDWHADDAVGDFVQHLENIAGFFGNNAHQHVVSIILDGENAWEYYPNDGYDFLRFLYDGLSKEHCLKTVTVSVGKSHPDCGSGHCIAKRFWHDRYHRGATFICSMPDLVVPPGQPTLCGRGCGTGFRPQGAAGTRMGHHRCYG